MNLHTRPQPLHFSEFAQEDPLDVCLPGDGSQKRLGAVIVIGFAAAFWFCVLAAITFLAEGLG